MKRLRQLIAVRIRLKPLERREETLKRLRRTGIFKGIIMKGSLARRNENKLYRETPVSRVDESCAKLEFRATFSEK